VAVLSAGPDALLAGLAALETHGLRGFEPDHLDVLLPAATKATAPPRGVRVHRTTLLPPADIHRLGDPPSTSAARAVIDAAQWAPSDRAARTIVAAALQQRLVHPDRLRTTLARMPRARRRATVKDFLRYATAGADTPTEAAFVRMCRSEGFPEPSMRHPRLDTTGRRRYLDAYFPDFGLHVEIDGGHHTNAAEWWSDMHRQNTLWIAGDRVLRFPAWVIDSSPTEAAAQVRAALTQAGWRPPTP